MRFWKRGLDLDCMSLNVNYHIQNLYCQGFSQNTNVTLIVPKLSFVESVFDAGLPAGGSRTRPLVLPEQKPVSLTFLIGNFCPQGVSVLNVCMGTGSTTKACLLPPLHFKFFRCEADDSFLSKALPSTLKVFSRQIRNHDSDINESEWIQDEARRYLQENAVAQAT